MPLDQRVLQVNHVCLIYYPENVERAVAALERFLGVPFPEIRAKASGFRVWMNLDAGLEILAPVGRAGDVGAVGAVAERIDSLYQHLDTRGEGQWAVVFGVADLDEAVERAADAGAVPGARWEGAPADVSPLYERFEEQEIGEFHGVNWLFGHIVPMRGAEEEKCAPSTQG